MNSSILLDNKPKRCFGIEITNQQSKNNSFLGRRRHNSKLNSNKIPKQNKQSRKQSPEQTARDLNKMQIQQEPLIKYDDPANQYKQQILNHLMYLEKNKSSKFFNYFQIQKDINEHMRSVLLNWLIEVHLKYKLLPQTLFIAVQIIDNYLLVNTIHRTKLQLLGITALWISAKYEQIYQVPKINNLIFICDSAYKRQQILEMQSLILEKLQFNLLKNNSYNFLELFRQYSDLQQKDYFLARYLIQISLLSYRMLKYNSRCVAAASIFFIKKIRRQNPSWNLILEQKTGCSEADIRPCARQICSILQNIDENEHYESLKKKFTSPEYLEVGKIKIGQKNKQ